MATTIYFNGKGIRVLLDEQELTLEDVVNPDGFLSEWTQSVSINKNGVLKIIAYSDSDISIYNNETKSGTPVMVSNGGSANININDYSGEVYIDISSGLEEFTYTLNITGFATEILQLVPFLTNIANAIRTKKGTTESINAQNFASEIESIESGGGDWTQEPSYSGTINLDSIYGSGVVYAFERYNENVMDYSKTSISTGSSGNITIDANMIFLDFNGKNTVTSMCQDLNNVEVLYDGGVGFGGFAIVKPTGDNWSFKLVVDD